MLRTGLLRLTRISLRLLAVGLFFLGVFPHFFAKATGRSCEEFTASRPPVEDPVTPAEIRLASSDVRQMRIPFLPLSFDAVALPGAVFFAREPDGILWYHEMIHMAQLRNDGIPRYAFTYLSDWYRGRLNGCGFHDAYMQIRYEREAYAMSEALTFFELVGFEQGGGSGLFHASAAVDSGRHRQEAFEVVGSMLAEYAAKGLSAKVPTADS